jgi:hypothetical protein
MRIIERIAPWLSRFVLAFAAFLFSMIGRKFIFDPVRAVQGAGIVLNTPMALTTVRAGFGGFSLACGMVALVCLVSGRRHRTGLWFVSILLGVVLAVRCYAIAIDGTLLGNVRVLSAELVLLSSAIIALLIGRAQA